jgi:Transposase IS4
MGFCAASKVAVYQWCDSRVVNVVSTYLNFQITAITCQIGPQQAQFACPAAIRHYQENMGGVDKGDQFRSHFGGFASQSHFKKWYKKVLMAILDCMLLNALNMWNLSVDKVPLHRKMKCFEFLQLLANELLHYKTEGLMSPLTERVHQAPVAMERGAMIGNGHTIIMSTKTIRCIVCSLELSQLEQLAKKNQGQRGMVLAERLARAYHGV